jgi:hypothetical protein
MARVVLFDVDGTVANGRPVPELRARPGIELTMQLLKKLGFSVDLWSKNGGLYAEEVAGYLGLPVDHCRDKAVGSIKAIQTRYGGTSSVALQVDNEPGDLVQGWPSYLVDSWWGEHATPELRDAQELAGDAVRRMGEVVEALLEAYSANRGDEHYTPAGSDKCVSCGLIGDECWARKAREVMHD